MSLVDGSCSDRCKQGDVTHVIDLAKGEIYTVRNQPQLDEFKDVKGHEITFGGLTSQGMAQAIQDAFNELHGWSTGDDQCDNMRAVFNMSRYE